MLTWPEIEALHTLLYQPDYMGHADRFEAISITDQLAAYVAKPIESHLDELKLIVSVKSIFELRQGRVAKANEIARQLSDNLQHPGIAEVLRQQLKMLDLYMQDKNPRPQL